MSMLRPPRQCRIFRGDGASLAPRKVDDDRADTHGVRTHRGRPMPRATHTVCFAGVADAVHDAGAAVCRRLVRGTSGEPSYAVAVRLSRRRGPEDLDRTSLFTMA